VVHIGGNKNVCGDLVGKSEGKKPHEEMGVVGRIILKWIERSRI
jgi:hypothetical protein